MITYDNVLGLPNKYTQFYRCLYVCMYDLSTHLSETIHRIVAISLLDYIHINLGNSKLIHVSVLRPGLLKGATGVLSKGIKFNCNSTNGLH